MKLEPRHLDVLLNSAKIFNRKRVYFYSSEDQKLHSKIDLQINIQVSILYFLFFWVYLFVLSMLSYITPSPIVIALVLLVVYVECVNKCNRILFIKRYQGIEVSETFYQVLDEASL